MTQTRKWTFGAVALAAVILLASWFLLISPQRSQAADVKAQTTTLDSENMQLTAKIATLKQQQKQLPKWQAQLAQLKTQLPPTPGLPGAIRTLSEYAKAAGLELTALTPATPKTVSAAGVVAAPTTTGVAPLAPGELASLGVQIEVEGGYFEFEQFVNSLERMNRVMLVTGLDYKVPPPEDTSTPVGGHVSGFLFLVPAGDSATAQTVGTAPAAE